LKEKEGKGRAEHQEDMGFVSLVGAGPGDPGLLTLKGVRCLERAEVVVYDHLVNERLLQYAPPGAELIYAGKKGAEHFLEQDEICALLRDRAGKGKRVVRLKGGDPFIFGRGGEEAEDLAASGIPFEVVPGVSSAIAVPSYAGIPLTHRSYTSTVGFITGHEDAARADSRIAWNQIATGLGTLVFLMGCGQLGSIAEKLIQEGRDPETPVALIRWGTLPTQETIVGNLRDIVQRAADAHFGPPVIIVVGEVVRLRSTLNWFENKPLFGKRILVTRTAEQASCLVQLLEAEGAEAIPLPLIQIQPPLDFQDLDRAIGQIEGYDWILFTSVHGVDFFWQRLRTLGKDARDLKGIRVGAIGPATASELKSHGLEPDLVPAAFQAEALLESLEAEGLSGTRVLLPRAEKARDLLPEGLRQRGAQVTVVEAYRTVKPRIDADEFRQRWEEGKIDVITFTSSSTVHHFMNLMEEMGKAGPESLGEKEVAVACIGPITGATARQYGLKVSIQPEEYTILGLAKAISDHFARGEKRP